MRWLSPPNQRPREVPNRPQVPPPGRRAGFTLIELLAVVSILMLLMALLFPVIGRARDQAKFGACTSNLGQLSVAINSWTADHNGNFTSMDVVTWGLVTNGTHAGLTGYGHLSQDWHNLLGWFGYIGRPIKIRREFTVTAYAGGPGVHDIWRYPILRDPGEPDWTTMYSDSNSVWSTYSGVPYNNWTHEFIGNSYHINYFVRTITACTCDRNWTTGGGLCGSDACDDWWGYPPRYGLPDENSCCAIGYQTLKTGITPARALILMDRFNDAMPNWHYVGFDPINVGFVNDYTDKNVYHMTDPRYLHAFRHPGQRANGMFHDGHVEAFRPMEYVLPSQRVQVSYIWNPL